jgi:thiosulfate reductase cytochrome b subunit
LLAAPDPEREELSFIGVLDAGVPFFCQSPLAIHRVGPAENGFMQKSYVGFWQVAKILHFLASFRVHPWTFLTFHEPMRKMIDWL